MNRLVVGLDLEHLDEARADHDLRDLVRALPPGTVRHAASHWASRGERPHVALSIETAALADDVVVERLTGRLASLGPRWALTTGGAAHGDVALLDPAVVARDAHVARRSGRAVHFRGVETLVGALPVRDLLDRSAIDRVRVLTAADAAPDAVVVTRGHVRPAWTGGELVLLTQPAVGGTLVPFESPSPTACCADH